MEQLLVLWGKDRTRIFENWGGEVVTPETCRAFIDEYPDADPLVSVYDFETSKERDAFLEGADEGNGWEEHRLLEDADDIALVKALLRVYIEDSEAADAAMYQKKLDAIEAYEARVLTPCPFEDGDLDELVHDMASQMASDINNHGVREQYRFLLEHGMTEEQIKARLTSA